MPRQWTRNSDFVASTPLPPRNLDEARLGGTPFAFVFAGIPVGEGRKNPVTWHVAIAQGRNQGAFSSLDEALSAADKQLDFMEKDAFAKLAREASLESHLWEVDPATLGTRDIAFVNVVDRDVRISGQPGKWKLTVLNDVIGTYFSGSQAVENLRVAVRDAEAEAQAQEAEEQHDEDATYGMR